MENYQQFIKMPYSPQKAMPSNTLFQEKNLKFSLIFAYIKSSTSRIRLKILAFALKQLQINSLKVTQEAGLSLTLKKSTK